MDTYNPNKENSNVSLIDAVETLSNIADLEFDKEIGITKSHDLDFQGQKITYRTVLWLHHRNSDLTLNAVKDLFKSILNYLHQFYKNDYSETAEKESVEGIKTVMVLVGEAAKKLDKYTNLFQDSQSKSVTELKEFRLLQDFYLDRIAQQIDKGQLEKWIDTVSQSVLQQKKVTREIEVPKQMRTKHVFVDLEGVKKDTEYELFLLRKEDGSRFFSPRLVRNIKLISNFGQYFEEKKDDPLGDLAVWLDRTFHLSAKQLLHYLKGNLDRFYQGKGEFKDHELVHILNKAYIALMLSADEYHLLKNNPAKSCTDYFIDFQNLMREALHSRDYQKLLTENFETSNRLSICLLDTIHATCYGLYTQLKGMEDISGVIQGLIIEANSDHATEERGKEISERLFNRLTSDYAALSKLLKNHPHGPLIKLLNLLEEGTYQYFDPLAQHNIPNQLYSLNWSGNKLLNIRMPTPTYQEFINKCSISEEFKGALRFLARDKALGKMLVFNFQDRTSWKDYHRCLSLETLQDQEEFKDILSIVTLAKDTEFYHQLAPYHNDNHADVFLKHFVEQLKSPDYGFFFPKFIHEKLFNGFIEKLLTGIHHVFFHSKNVLTREQRMEFISLTYLFVELKIVEILKPHAMSFLCKDGVDIGITSSIELLVFLKAMNLEEISKEELEKIDLMIYSSALLIRERVMSQDRFRRMVNVIKAVENEKTHLGNEAFKNEIDRTFGKLYESSTLTMKVE